MGRIIFPLWTAGALLAASWLAPTQTVAQQPAAVSPGLAASTVPNGTRFLVRLENDLSTRKHKVNKKFKARTLEPLETGSGLVVPPGAEIRGHISRIEPAQLTGHARLWLTFDELRTKQGKLPIVAEVVSVPGDHSVRRGESKEGEIEARRSRSRQDLEAAAAGAAIGAVAGAAGNGKKGAAMGAVMGAAVGFLVSTGMGQELELPKGTKLELELGRPLYVATR